MVFNGKKLVGMAWRALPVWGRRLIIRATQPSFTVSAAIILINDEKQVLLLNHVLRPASGWGAPGGFLNPNEQPHETAEREVFEETGLRVEQLTMFRVQTRSRHIEFWFTGTANGTARVKSREILEAKWFAPTEMPPEMSKKERFVIEQAMQIGERDRI